METLQVGIIGGAGYTGGELIRILINHPQVSIRFVHSKSNAGNPLYSVHSDLLGDTALLFASEIRNDIDVLFLCVGHGDAKKWLTENSIDEHIRIIDLSQDFRLLTDGKQPVVNGRPFVYGLPELNKEQIKGAQHIANPGCFATAIQLGLLPLAQARILAEVQTTGITGSTGAGQRFTATSQFSWRANNIQAYKTLTHQHLKEIGQSLQQLYPERTVNIHFVPWRGDFTRGIFISSQLDCSMDIKDLYALYESYYEQHPFTIISREPVFLKQVVNTNKCMVQLEKEGNKLVVHTVMDNLLKGASGQAVQNMNLMFGLNETAGLKLKAGYF
ncbi:MAG: N-acetyl-gamma-glutamyl-phosphate reductase [Chitinophagaceae bacterium]